jgi:hypothetical protein
MKKKQNLKKLTGIFLVIAMIGTMGILSSFKTIFNKPNNEVSVNKEIKDKTENNDIAKAIKKQSKVNKSNVFLYKDTAVAAIVVESTITDKEVEKMKKESNDSLKKAYPDKNIRIDISNKDGVKLDTNSDKSMPKASITIIDTKIQYKTYVQVKLDTKEAIKYCVVINGKKLELFIRKDTKEILFDTTLDGTYEKNDLIPVVFKLN